MGFQVAQYLVNELAHADNDGANKYDRYGKLPLQYARENQGLAAKQAYWKTLETTMLLKTKDYVKGDEVSTTCYLHDTSCIMHVV